jgi:DNA-binding MarR family transcriptional regulator
MRATELAARTRITEQSIAALLDQLEGRGYVERRDDPGDQRAKRVVLTPRGRQASRVIRATVRRSQADWGRRVGHERVNAMEQTLRDLVASLQDEEKA